MRNKDDLAKHILAAFQAWNQPEGSEIEWWAGLLYAQELAGRMRREGPPPTGRDIERALCELALQDMSSRRPRRAEAITRRFKDNESPQTVADHFSISEPTLYYWQQKACADMGAYILAKEEALRRLQTATLLSDLPPKRYTRLFGADMLIENIINRITESDPTKILALTGYGGVGKSALADAATRALIANFRFPFVVWVRYSPATMDGRSRTPAALFEAVMLKLAEQPQIAAQNYSRPERNRMVRAALKSAPYLVIVDNVEEPADLDALLAELPLYTGPSQFLITSRARPEGTNHIPLIVIQPLSRPDSKALWRFEAELTNFPGLADVEDAHLDALYDRIGGNPLMIKVTVGLATQFCLDDIIADLEQQPTGLTDQNFRRVFARAWAALSDNARMVLQSMAMIGEEGTNLEHLAAISKLDEHQTRAVVQELTSRSLLEVRGVMTAMTYGVHHLTRTFINASLVEWRDNV